MFGELLPLVGCAFLLLMVAAGASAVAGPAPKKPSRPAASERKDDVREDQGRFTAAWSRLFND